MKKFLFFWEKEFFFLKKYYFSPLSYKAPRLTTYSNKTRCINQSLLLLTLLIFMNNDTEVERIAKSIVSVEQTINSNKCDVSISSIS